MLSDKNSKHNQTKAGEERGIYNELQKELIRALGNNTANPWAEMIEFPHTTIRVAVMMRSIRLELATCRAIGWPSVILTDVDILHPEFLLPSLVERKSNSASLPRNVCGLRSRSSHFFIAPGRSPVSII